MRRAPFHCLQLDRKQISLLHTRSSSLDITRLITWDSSSVFCILFFITMQETISSPEGFIYEPLKGYSTLMDLLGVMIYCNFILMYFDL